LPIVAYILLMRLKSYNIAGISIIQGGTSTGQIYTSCVCVCARVHVRIYKMENVGIPNSKDKITG